MSIVLTVPGPPVGKQRARVCKNRTIYDRAYYAKHRERGCILKNNLIQLTIPGPPVGKQRARICRTGHFTPAKTVNYETLIKELFAIQYPNHAPWTGPILMHVTAYFPIPKSTPKKRLADMEAEHAWYPHRIDGDNLWKIIADALNGIAYADDGQLVDGRVLKYYSPRPRVEIEIEELP